MSGGVISCGTMANASDPVHVIWPFPGTEEEVFGTLLMTTATSSQTISARPSTPPDFGGNCSPPTVGWIGFV